MEQYLIVTIIVLIIVGFQIKAFFNNAKLIRKLKSLFPNTELLVLDKDSNTISCDYSNSEFEETLDDINAYLSENKNKNADYQIIKESVERNSLKLEESVDTMLSTPLYYGLMATILGAAIGIGFFAYTDLESVLTGAKIETDGIKTLLIDIAIAMCASFFGVLCTSTLTSRFKDARADMLRNKNRFLTWIQTKVMPNMVDDLSGALTKMAQDLNNFNSTFSNNTKELKETLAMVSENYEGQVEILESIEKLKITKVAKANIEVYDKLQGCTEVLERLFEHLGESETYINKVVELNSKIGEVEERTRLFEELGQYFKNEIEFVRDRQGMMRQQMSGLDSVLQDALENLGASVSSSIANLTTVFQQQNQQVQALIEEQQVALSSSLEEQRTEVNKKIEEFNDPFANLKDVYKEIGEQTRIGIEGISASFERQNSAIQEMLTLQRTQFENEIVAQRKLVKEQMGAMPNQLQTLTSMIEQLNESVYNQQKQIDSQSTMMQEIVNKNNAPIHKANNKLVSYIVVVGVSGSFILLLLIFIAQLFEIKF